MSNSRNNRKYRKPSYKKQKPVKFYEIEIILAKDGKSYKAYAPAYATSGVLNALTNIVDYMKKYGEIGFSVCNEPVV